MDLCGIYPNKIIAKIQSCNKETYSKIYLDVVEKVFLDNKINIDKNQIFLEVIDISNNGLKSITQQRKSKEYRRTIDIYVGNQLKYIVGLPNTSYDEDRLLECNLKGKTLKTYGKNGNHGNTYLTQGINRIINFYLDSKNINPNVKLYFYLLDTNESHPKNATNILSYKMLSTLGFSILNISDISFDEFEKIGLKAKDINGELSYNSINKLMNDMITVSKKNTGNIPSYIKCIEDNELDVINDYRSNTNYKYIYTYKGLAANAYSSFLAIWTIYELSKREKKKIEFLFSKEKFNLKNKKKMQETDDLPNTLKELFSRLEVPLCYQTAEEILQQEQNRFLNQLERARKENDIRNQELFKNNLRKKGVLTKCCLCGCEIEDILEAAHLWGVAQIKNESSHKISNILNEDCMKDILADQSTDNIDSFYKKYLLANSGDNGVWLCKNHHGLFDSNYYCFNPETGDIINKSSMQNNAKDFIERITNNRGIDKDLLTEKTKLFLKMRNEIFNQ